MAKKNGVNYKVGYKKPPRNTQFKKNQSGNPKGRPIESSGLAADLQKEMRSKVTVIENSRRRKITKSQAIAKRIVHQAAGGDSKAVNALVRIGAATPGEGNSQLTEKAFEPNDEPVIADIIRRIEQAYETKKASDLLNNLPENT